MLFLGHMCWAYVFGKGTSRLTSRKVQVQLILLCGILSDSDILLRIRHGGIMHSVALWIAAFVPILLWIGPRRGLPYLIAALQHPLFGDFITSKYQILLPFSANGYGLGVGLLSPIGLSLEVLGFAAFIAITLLTGELKALFSTNPVNALSALPAMAMLISYGIAIEEAGDGHGINLFQGFQVLFLLLLFGSALMGVIGLTFEGRHERDRPPTE